MSDHHWTEEELVAWISGDAPPAVAEAIESALATDPQLLEQVLMLAATITAVGTCAAESAGGGMEAGGHRAVQRRRPASRRSLWRFAAAASALAASVLAILALSARLHHEPAPQVVAWTIELDEVQGEPLPVVAVSDAPVEPLPDSGLLARTHSDLEVDLEEIPEPASWIATAVRVASEQEL